jgi:hypothetical protein
LPQSSQCLQGSPTPLRALCDGMDDAAAAATVMKPPTSTARQPKKAARVRRRFISQLWDFERTLPRATRSQTRDAYPIRRATFYAETDGALARLLQRLESEPRFIARLAEALARWAPLFRSAREIAAWPGVTTRAAMKVCNHRHRGAGAAAFK